MADLTKKMSPDNPTQILTTHDLSSLRTVQRVLTAAAVVEDNSNSHHNHNHNHAHNHSNNSIGSVNSNHNHNHNNNHNNSGSSTGNLVFSTIPLDGHALLIQHSLPAADVSIAGNLHQHHHQQQRSTVTTTNGLRLTSVAAALNSHSNHNHLHNNNNNHSNSNNNSNSSNNSNLLAKAGLSAAGKGGKSAGTLNGNMPGTSKYVLLQQNGNGQFTTYEGTTATGGSSSGGNIVLLATEPMDLNGSVSVGGEQARIIATGGDNDEELRPLAWLNDSNLIKGIVTTTTAAGSNVAGGSSAANIKRQLGSSGGSICIVNASNAHELIEELPPHMAGEEHVSTASSTSTNNSNNNNNHNNSLQSELSHGGSQKITALSVSDFQQQFKRFGNIIAAGAPITLLPQDATAASRKDDQHIFGNIAAIGATTTVHVGPSGTTTVVEYKSNANFLPAQRPQLGGVGGGNGNSNGNGTAAGGVSTNVAANAATITATNLNNNNNNTNSNYVPSSSSSSTTTASSHHQIPATVSTSAPASIALSLTAQQATTSASSAPTTSTTTAATLNIPKQLTLPGGIVGAANGNSSAAVANGNNTTNTIYQGQQKQQSGGNSSTSSATTTTTHHPHKKYLREKMNVLDHGGGGGSGVGGGGGGVGVGNSNIAAITVVASPASSSNSLSSTASSASSSATSSSTAAVNGGNSPISKTFYTGHNNSSTAAGIALNYSNSSNSSTSAFVSGTGASAPSPTTSAAASPIATGLPAYTIMQYPNITSSPVMSSPEPPNSKDYYTLITPQQQQRNSMRSPTSYSSYDNDSLKDFEVSNASSTATIARHNTSTPQQQQQQQQMTPKSGNSHASASLTPQKQKHPNNVPYDPFVHTHSKPPYSFSSLIFMAIEGSNEKALPVKEIYAWIVQHFPYFKSAPTGWKNSVRHNLSLNKSFIKVEKAPNMGKGSLWRVEPQQRPNLIQALSRSPFFPNSAVDKIVVKSPGGGSINTPDASAGYDTIDSGVGAHSPVAKGGLAHINPRFDPRLFPKLSKAFKDIGDIGMLSDVADDEIPSDYSTSNHASHNHSSNNNNNNNNISNTNNNTNNNSTSHNNKYTSYPPMQNGSGGGGGGGGGSSGGGSCGTGGSGGSIMGAFSNYESIERLARDCGADSIEDVNAATAMLALKHGPKVFAETFQNGAPVITSSPSEDHTYSAGGGGSGASTPLTNGNAAPQAALTLNGNGVLVASNGQQNGCGDNQSNCASSDAAYESSEENHNITPEELADQQRHLDGVDALLSLSLSSVVEPSSSSRSPTKRPSSTSVEEEHSSVYQESSNGSISNGMHHPHHQSQQPHMGKVTLLSNGASYNATQQQPPQPPQAHHAMFDEGGYSAPSYYGSSVHHHQPAPNQHGGHHAPHHLNSAASAVVVAKKVKPLRSLRTKMKRKALIR